MEIKTSTKKDGGYKPGSSYLKGPFCKMLQMLCGDLFYEILAAAGVDDCPLPGALKVEGFYFNSDKVTRLSVYGEAMSESRFYVDEKIVGCYIMYLKSVPKED